MFAKPQAMYSIIGALGKLGARPALLPPRTLSSDLCSDCGEKLGEWIYWCQNCRTVICENCRHENHVRHKVWVKDPGGRWQPCSFDWEQYVNRGVLP